MNGSGYRRLFVSSFTVLLSLILVTSVFAAKPDSFTIPVDDLVTVGDCGGFELMEHIEGTIRVSEHVDRDGNFVMSLSRFSLHHTYINSVTGDTLRTPDVGLDKVTVNEDGSGTVAVIGIVGRIVIPGEGLVFAHLGRIVFDLETDAVVFEAGRHDDFGELFALLCEALG
jgi:hypothetical protein